MFYIFINANVSATLNDIYLHGISRTSSGWDGQFVQMDHPNHAKAKNPIIFFYRKHKYEVNVRNRFHLIKSFRFRNGLFLFLNILNVRNARRRLILA